LDKPLHVILNHSKLAYRIYVILIANKEFKIKKIGGKVARHSGQGFGLQHDILDLKSLTQNCANLNNKEKEKADDDEEEVERGREIGFL
jgi:hypothetical protein